MESGAFDDHEEIVAPGDEVAALDFGEIGDATREAIEAAAAFWGDADFDHGGDAT